LRNNSTASTSWPAARAVLEYATAAMTGWVLIVEPAHSCCLAFMTYSAGLSALPDLRGCSSINLREHGIEASEAAESGENSDFRHRLIGFIDEPFRALYSGCPCHRAGTGLEVPGEQAGKLAATHPKALGKFLDRRSISVESTLLDDKPYRALDGCTAADPRVGKRRGLGTAPQTRPKPRCFCGRSRRKKPDVGRPRGAHGADRSTIDAGSPDPGEKPAVIAGITRDARAIAFREVHQHHGALIPSRGRIPVAPPRDGVPSRRATLQRPRYPCAGESTSLRTRSGGSEWRGPKQSVLARQASNAP
jgi:hypothetical protein